MLYVIRCMKIILLQDVPKIGKKYQTVKVADGYGLNFLIPRGLGKAATPRLEKELSKKREGLETEMRMREELLIKSLSDLGASSITLKVKVSDKGHLFKGVTKEMITEETKKQLRIEFDPEHITLEHPIKEVGEYELDIAVGENKGNLKVVVETE